MRYLLFLFIQISFANAVFAQTPPIGSVDFTIRNAGFNVKGSFSDLKASIQFNPNDLENSKITASVSAESINTNNNARDRHLRKEDYFWTDKFPRIQMKSISFKKTETGFEGVFEVEIKGTKRNITVPFSVQKTDNVSIYKGNFGINRREFNVGGNSLILSNQANLFIEVRVEN